MTQNQAEDNANELVVPISSDRLKECLASAKRWTGELPGYADRNQLKADFWAISAGILAATSGLAIFPVLGDNSGILVKTMVSAVALASAVCALFPRVKNYGEEAGTARLLAAQFGTTYGRLLDLVEEAPVNQHAARIVVAEYQSLMEKKDALRELATWKEKRYHAKLRSRSCKRESRNTALTEGQTAVSGEGH